MRKFLAALLLSIVLLLPLNAQAASKIYGFTALAGSGVGALGAIDGTALADKDMAVGVVGGIAYTYYLNATSGADEASPTVIAPATSAGQKRWILSGDGTRTIIYNQSGFDNLSAVTTNTHVTIIPGTYVVTPGSITISSNLVTLEFSEGAVLTTTGADFAIKVTGNDVTIKGPGAITSSATPEAANAGVTELRKATIWNTGDRLKVEGVTFNGSLSYTIFNEGGDDLEITRNRFLGGWTTYVLTDGTNHFAYYQDGGSRNVLAYNYTEHYAQGFGSGLIGGSGSVMNVLYNRFYRIGNHSVYIQSGGDGSLIQGNVETSVGGGSALTGERIKYNHNEVVFLDPATYGAQSGFAFRNPVNCEAIGNIFTGVSGGGVILSATNTGAGVAINGVKIAKNVINVTGTATYAIQVGNSAATTSITDVSIDDNSISGVDQDNVTKLVGLINIYPKAITQASNCSITNNKVRLQNASTGISMIFTSGGIIANNIVRNTTTLGSATVMRAYSINQSNNIEVQGNVTETTTSANLTLWDIVETGTNVQVYKNRYINHRVNTALTGTSFVSISLVAGNGSQVINYKTDDAIDVNAGGTWYMKFGNVLFLTASGGNRNVNPYASQAYPVGYQLDIYNTDGANTITFDSTALNKTLAVGKHGIFHYTGTAWVGGQID